MRSYNILTEGESSHDSHLLPSSDNYVKKLILQQRKNMTCENCGQHLSTKEKHEIEEARSHDFSVKNLCDHCWNQEVNSKPSMDDFSDADNGL